MKIIKKIPVSTGKRLKFLIKEQGLTQQDFAKQFGAAPKTVSMWVNDGYKIRDSTLREIADFFSVDVDYLTCKQVEKRKGAWSKDYDESHKEENEKLRADLTWFEYLESIGCTINASPALVGQHEDEFATIENGELIIYSDTLQDAGDWSITITLPGGSTACFQESQWEQIQNEIAEYTLFKLTKANIKKEEPRPAGMAQKEERSNNGND